MARRYVFHDDDLPDVPLDAQLRWRIDAADRRRLWVPPFVPGAFLDLPDEIVAVNPYEDTLEITTSGALYRLVGVFPQFVLNIVEKLNPANAFAAAREAEMERLIQDLQRRSEAEGDVLQLREQLARERAKNQEDRLKDAPYQTDQYWGIKRATNPFWKSWKEAEDAPKPEEKSSGPGLNLSMFDSILKDVYADAAAKLADNARIRGRFLEEKRALQDALGPYDPAFYTSESAGMTVAVDELRNMSDDDVRKVLELPPENRIAALVRKFTSALPRK